MKKAMMAAGCLLVLACGTALAQAAGANPAQTMGDLLAASGWGNGLWKGALLGLLRGLFGYWSKSPDDQSEKWDWAKFLWGGIAGATCGGLAGRSGLTYDTFQGWAAQFGITEAGYRFVQGLFRKYGVPLGAQVAAKAMEIRERKMRDMKSAPPAAKQA